MKRKISPRLSPLNPGMSPMSKKRIYPRMSPLSPLSGMSPLSLAKSSISASSAILLITVMLIFLPIIFLTSCEKISVNEMLDEYNTVYDPDFAEKYRTKKMPELIPQNTYEVDYKDEIKITAMKGLFNYSWTLNDSNGKIYNCDTGMYIIYINTSSLGLEKGDYTLSVSAKDVSNNKYTDAAVVIVK